MARSAASPEQPAPAPAEAATGLDMALVDAARGPLLPVLADAPVTYVLER